MGHPPIGLRVIAPGAAPVLEVRALELRVTATGGAPMLEESSGDLDSSLEDRVTGGSRTTRISSSRPSRELLEGRPADRYAAADMCPGHSVWGGEWGGCLLLRPGAKGYQDLCFYS